MRIPPGNPSGFTLAELLIALVILGTIATFAIPKVISAQKNDRKKAVMRECVSAVQSTMHQALISGAATETTLRTYLIDQANLNYVRKCNNSEAEGCWTVGMSNGQTTGRGIVMHSGCAVVGFDNTYTGDHEYLVFDWNGPDGPNVEGQDQMQITFALPPNGYSGRSAGSFWGKTAASDALYQEVFSN